MPLVIGLGVLNLALVVLFWGVGGMDFRAPRRALGVRARQTMGRRAGAGWRRRSRGRTPQRRREQRARRCKPREPPARTSTPPREPPAERSSTSARPRSRISRALSRGRAARRIPRCCATPLAFPRAVRESRLLSLENKNIRARNARRRAAATNALQALVAAARDKQDRAHGKRALVRVDE